MTRFRLILPILATALGGGAAHAAEFSLGAARMLAANTPPPDMVTFTERGRALREPPAEGGDSAPGAGHQRLRGADAASAERRNATPAKPVTPDSDSPAATPSDSNHGASSVSPAAVIRRPSYRWQSLVPGTIK